MWIDYNLFIFCFIWYRIAILSKKISTEWHDTSTVCIFFFIQSDFQAFPSLSLVCLSILLSHISFIYLEWFCVCILHCDSEYLKPTIFVFTVITTHTTTATTKKTTKIFHLSFFCSILEYFLEIFILFLTLLF